MGRQHCRRLQPGQPPHPRYDPQVPGSHQVRSHHTGARRHPRHRLPELGRNHILLRQTHPPSLATLRHDLTLEVLNEAGQVTNTYTIQNSWVSEYQALPDLDAGANAIDIQHIKLENEGWTENA